MHHIRLKRAENLLKGVEPSNYHVVLAENKFSDSEIQEYLAQKNFGIEPIQETDNVEVKAAIVETPKQTKSKMQFKIVTRKHRNGVDLEMIYHANLNNGNWELKKLFVSGQNDSEPIILIDETNNDNPFLSKEKEIEEEVLEVF